MRFILISILNLCFGIVMSAQVLLSTDYPSVANLQTVVEGGSLTQKQNGAVPDSMWVTSIEELVAAVKSSSRVITMAPGDYYMSDYLTSTIISNTVPDASSRSAMIDISGSNNIIDLTGVTINVETELLDEFGLYVIEFYVTGDNNDIKGLTLTDIGNEPTYTKGGCSVVVQGDNVHLTDFELNTSGSFPYGYGDLLGKGDAHLVTLRKHSGMLINGANDTIIDCSIISRSFGHCFFVQGGRNTYFEGCYAEGTLRTTDEMLAETSGTLFDLDFECIYTDRNGSTKIPSGYVKSTCECGFRTYGSGGVDGEATGAVTAVNCTAKNTRIGFAFTKVNEPMLIENAEVIACETGFNLTGCDVVNSTGDASVGPLLFINSGGSCDIDLTLKPDTSSITVHAIACIVGSGHTISLKGDSTGTRPLMHDIFLGTSRSSACNPWGAYGTSSASNITLTNTTGMPVELNSKAVSCTVSSDGTISDSGSYNTVTTIE